MRAAKPWLSKPLVVAEGKRMVRVAASPKGGDTVKAQIRNAGRNLELDHWTIWNAWHGKIGARAFPKLSVAYHHWIDGRARSELDALRARIERLEQNHNLGARMDSKPHPGRRMGAAKS
jgi:hypothetical protein